MLVQNIAAKIRSYLAGAVTIGTINGLAVASGSVAAANPATTYTRVGDFYSCRGATAPVSVDVPIGSIFITDSGLFYFKYGAAATNWNFLFQQNGIGYSVNGLSVSAAGLMRLDTGITDENILQATALTGNVTDWDPGGGSGTNLWKNQSIFVTSDAARVINSIIRPPQGYRLRLRLYNKNTDAARTITLLHDDGATGTATARFLCPGNVNLVIPVNSFADIYNDTVGSNRWLSR
jgi:hypothetical protein